MTSKRRRSKAISHEVAEVVSQHFQERKVAPTSTEQLPVVITEERRNVKELTLFEVGLLPFLYLEAAVKYVFNYINERYPLK
tara:strand:- start:2504 stop:2749 length:246 start_codon:yes stop_codon:yes gene_type:complete